jgi:hypothetical protein
MKTMIFHVMRTFRWLIVPLLRLASAIFVMAFVMALISEDPEAPVISGFIFAVVFSSAAWGYDVMVKKLSPVNQTNQEWS